LQRSHLEKILDIELGRVQERITGSLSGKQFVFKCTEEARDFLLREGTDTQFGARHLKRAIERYLVFPLSNLIATGQIGLGDLVIVDYDPSGSKLTFVKEDSGAVVGSAEETVAEAVAAPTPRGRASVAKALAKRASASKERSE
jgi:ATP-dependent Clp protease ATP-binding subunit ClpB